MTIGRHVVLGLDPGLAAFGYGLIAAEGDAVQHLGHGCVETPAGMRLPDRLRQIYDTLSTLARENEITDVAVEEVFHTRNVRTALTVGHARGVALLATARAGVELAEYTPSEVKQAVGGYGRAAKGDVQRMVALVLSLGALPWPDDAADALAVALCHARRIGLSERLCILSGV